MGKTFSNRVDAGVALAGFAAEGKSRTFGVNPGFVADISAMMGSAHTFGAKQGVSPGIAPTTAA